MRILNDTHEDKYTQGDGDVISSYHIYASCLSTMWGKLCGMFVIVTALS